MFILGLGTQVRGHNERRFSVDWTALGPCLREVIESLWHIWFVSQEATENLDREGDHYSFSLLPKVFDPGPINNPNTLL